MSRNKLGEEIERMFLVKGTPCAMAEIQRSSKYLNVQKEPPEIGAVFTEGID